MKSSKTYKMRKRIIIKESALEALKRVEEYKLPDFLYKALKNKKTSLGENPAFPSGGYYDFDYCLIKERYKQVKDNVLNILNSNNIDIDDLSNLLNKLYFKAREIEKPLKTYLERLCENIVNKYLCIPPETVNLECSLVDEVQNKFSMRITPEETNENEYEDASDFDSFNSEIMKRRFIDSLIQGFSYNLCEQSVFDDSDVRESINKVSPELLDIYKKIMAIDDYLIFAKSDKISDENPMQTSYVEVRLGHGKNRTDIKSVGVLFPYLLKETFKGFFELFSSHGLPKDNKRAMAVIKNADFIKAEPWDIRFGKALVDKMKLPEEKTDVLPFFFTSLCKFDTSEFNRIIKEILLHTKEGKKFIEEEYSAILNYIEYGKFKETIQQKNLDHSLIVDGIMTEEEIDNYQIEEGDTDKYEKLINADATEIDFSADEIGVPSLGKGPKHPIYQLNIMVGDETYTSEDGINMMAEDVSEGLYQLHIYIAPNLRRKGLAEKLYYAFLIKCSDIVSLFKNRTRTAHSELDPSKMNSMDDAIPGLWNKLSQLPGVTVSDYKNDNGVTIGQIARYSGQK